MNLKLLSRHLQQPTVRSHLLRGYNGPCSIGIGLDPAGSGRPAVIVEVQDVTEFQAPTPVEFNGESFPVVVRGGYAQARPLAH